MTRHVFVLAAAVLPVLVQSPVEAAQFSLEKSNEGAAVTVKLDGKLFTRYLTKSGAKPILWPVIGPYGNEVTRAYPMVPEGKPGEKKDHHHHRSFWFTHGDVNGISFWHENGKHGTIVHRDFLKVKDGPQAVISTVNDWIGPDGKKICEDVRTFTFAADGDARRIDVDIKVVASEGEVTFGDTKEGSFGVRVAGTMKETAGEGGRLVNDKGQASKDAWGKPASWVDYHGPVEGNTVGIAILNHPSSFRYPTHWHVRTYGLFAANPFGLHDFYGRKKGIDGSHTLKKGESFDLHYRVLIHKGDEKTGQVAKHFEKYSKQPRP